MRVTFIFHEDISTECLHTIIGQHDTFYSGSEQKRKIATDGQRTLVVLGIDLYEQYQCSLALHDFLKMLTVTYAGLTPMENYHERVHRTTR